MLCRDSRRDIAISAASLVLIGISLGCSQQPRERAYSGIYTLAMEHQGFKVDGSDEEWWASGDVGDLNLAVMRTLPDGGRFWEGKGKVTLRGIVSSKGRYGHGGLWPRQITVMEVISVVPTN